jgi:hypothetical protein
MLGKLRAHLTYANVMATIAMILAVGGGTAVAAKTLTGRNIKNSSLTGADIKNRSIGTRDLTRSAQGRRGPTGARGLTGAQGATGPRGKSSSEPLDSGQTVSGYERLDVESPNSGDFQLGVSLPGVAPVALTDANVNFAADGNAATSEDDASCTGTANNPTAPAGKACLYLIAATTDTTSISGNIGNAAQTRGFRAVWADPSTSDDVFLEFSWAYTAP